MTHHILWIASRSRARLGARVAAAARRSGRDVGAARPHPRIGGGGRGAAAAGTRPASWSSPRMRERRRPPAPLLGTFEPEPCTCSFRSRPPSETEEAPGAFAGGSTCAPRSGGGLSFARRARPNRPGAGLLTPGWAPPRLHRWPARHRSRPDALRSPEPSRAAAGPVASLGFAPRSQWRDRAGLAPASLFGPGTECHPPGSTSRRIYAVGRIIRPAAAGVEARGRSIPGGPFPAVRSRRSVRRLARHTQLA